MDETSSAHRDFVLFSNSLAVPLLQAVLLLFELLEEQQLLVERHLAEVRQFQLAVQMLLLVAQQQELRVKLAHRTLHLKIKHMR